MKFSYRIKAFFARMRGDVVFHRRFMVGENKTEVIVVGKKDKEEELRRSFERLCRSLERK